MPNESFNVAMIQNHESGWEEEWDRVCNALVGSGPYRCGINNEEDGDSDRVDGNADTEEVITKISA
ncbi:MAG: hypothetical protein PHQ75_01600 [Thermoguttaceae bacterium]|nr:hypothetical protein [Thermoguttaceae bacterium]